jgi:hypothetical protein
MSKRKLVLVAVALALCMPVFRGHSQEPKKPPDKKVETLMRRKLDNSQKVLEGIAVHDFKMIGKHADELIDISKQAEWKAIRTPQYELYSNEFRRVADDLVKNAKDKNLDGAALTYVELTLTCVKCHKYVREVQQAGLDLDLPSLLVRTTWDPPSGGYPINTFGAGLK